jgi:hypothetical protein
MGEPLLHGYTLVLAVIHGRAIVVANTGPVVINPEASGSHRCVDLPLSLLKNDRTAKALLLCEFGGESLRDGLRSRPWQSRIRSGNRVLTGATLAPYNA